MKRIAIYIGILLLVAGCFPDNRNNFMVPDGFGISATNTVLQASLHTGTYSLGIAKSGIGQSAGSVSITVSQPACEEALAAYNKANKKKYKTIGASFITLDKEQLAFDQKDVAQTVTLSWDPEVLAAFVGLDTNYVVPILINSQDLEVKDGRGFVMLHPNRSGINVPQTSVARVVEAKDVEPGLDGKQPELQETVVLDVNLKPAIKNLGIHFPVCIDNSLIDAYNLAHDTQYQAAPEGLVTLVDKEAVIAEGALGGSFRILLDKSVLLKDGKLEEFPDYLIPVRLDEKKLSATLSGKEFELKGLSYNNLVTYVSFTYYAPPPGLSVIRLWGKYSTTGAAWSDYIEGFTAGADRNVAVDDNYVYIAETNTSKNLWAISLADPGIYKKLPVGTVADAGTFYLSCPRIIPNTDANINGGKDVLMVSNMIAGDPTLYIYDKGIDQDPTALGTTTWASRRLGDTFTYWGTLQNGILFFKDFNSTQGTVTLPMSGSLTSKPWLHARIAAPAVTGAGAYFPFPENINKGISTVRGGATSWLTSTTKDLATLEGADNNPTLTELSGYYADAAFRFFQFEGKPYIAYSRQVDASDGRLFILEGEPGESWESMLEARNVIYQAAIQNDAEQEAALEPEASPMASGNSGMDLDVRISGNEVYIAVIKQNVGLSLFRMSMN